LLHRISYLSLSVLVLTLILSAFLGSETSFAEADAVQGGKWANEQAKKVHRQGGYPNKLPVLGEKKQPRSRSGQGCQASQSQGLEANGCASAGTWALLVMIVMLGMYLLVSFSRRNQTSEEKQDNQIATEVLGIQLPVNVTLEELLAKGDWETAICFLLLKALKVLGWKDSGRGRSTTAREVVFKFSRSAPGARSLHALLRVAESVRFGGISANEALFEEAQGAFQQFISLQEVSEYDG